MSSDINVKRQVLSILVYILKGTLQLLSPIMPFITSEIWQKLNKNEKIIAESVFPKIKSSGFLDSLEKMRTVQDIIVKIRTLRSEMNIFPAVQIEALFNIIDESKEKTVRGNESYIKQLAKIIFIRFGKNIERPKNSALVVAGGFEMFLPLEGLIDIGKEKTRLAKEIALAKQEVERTMSKLNNENFVKRAPKIEIEKIQARFNDANLKIEKINENLKFLR
jgi:valyl-tRNA synthetase